MKKLILICAVAFGLATTAAAQTKPAEFKFDKEIHDFGKIAQGKPVTAEFKFTNIGDEPLIITNVESTCGCTVPEYTNTPVQKGGTGVIKVTFNAAAAMPFSKTVTVKSSAKTPIKVLYIKGEVVAGNSK